MGKYFLYFFNVLIFRVFDQYEINIEITKHRHSYLATASDSPPEVDYQEFGLWDAIYNLGLTTASVFSSLLIVFPVRNRPHPGRSQEVEAG